MEIKYAIHSANNNPLYLDFWPLVAKIWHTKFNIIPILIYVGNEPLKLDNKYGEVVHLPLIEKLPAPLQAQWARFWYTQHLSNQVGIISDIDMLPLSFNYFVTQLKHIHHAHYVHLNPCIAQYGALPACYHVATGHTFKKIFQLNPNWATSVKELWDFNTQLPPNFKYHHNHNIWFADERYTTYQIMDTDHGVKTHFLPRKGSYDSLRIDRNYWKYNKKLLAYDYYIDCHLPRPYQNHQSDIDDIMNCTLLASNKQPGFFYRAYQKIKAFTN